MASSVPVEVIDDDDDFDWDAAVREIDVACSEATKVSSSGVNRNSNLQTGSGSKIENKKPASSRQSTLDRFIGLSGLKSANQDVKHAAQDKVECNDERLSNVSIDTEAAKTWIYPENISIRDYQASMTRTALFSNTLVSLPTGLGKTLIAAVVMYNYYRWFPEGKIVFAAPSRPLVMQQIEACHKIVGIPQEYTVDMTGQTSPSKRAGLWKAKRVFFLTPEVLQKDIQSGRCEVKQLVCLVLDEAHRATGNYAASVAVRLLLAVPVHLRLLALTATPGSTREKVQEVIDNLQISSLEYRSESDPDVAPFVHARETELIQVEMGKDANEVNDLLLELTRRFQSRLSSYGVLANRDPRTLSSCDYLKSREKYREAPPQNLPPSNHGEIEGLFAVLIALSQIRKMLSGYGIGPAFETLEDKFKKGSFSRFMSTNEDLWKAKAIMQQSLSLGFYSSKISKMLEVLVDHFKKQDSHQSRVIIFSNYRGSVREIMNALTKIGANVKATEFIGQNSGKSKGQSQKVQQAVLEKFRAGEYNVIVATSIGEEGLDIMEVDLVVCFDANVSPLRMTQRMGRTGRKNEGRVVVLAFEGAEVNGYKRKLALSKAFKKLMVNGGRNNFRFYSSPRMIPHVFRPEKVLVKFSIEAYVRRGKKVKNDDSTQTPKYKLKLTNTESDLIAKFFNSPSENDWRPSLIAFPHFQAFPSRVHKVAHSMSTVMLIDTMQNLQDLSFSVRDEETSEGYFKAGSIEHHNNNIREDDPIEKEAESDILSPMKHNAPDVLSPKPCAHSFLFGSDFASVDSIGRVMILSVPSFPFTKTSSPHPFMSDFIFTPVKISHLETLTTQGNDDLLEPSRRNTPHAVLDDSKAAAADLSPRLTNLLLSGIVPESPIAKDDDMLPDTSTYRDQNENSEGEIRAPEIELANSCLEKRVSDSKFVGETTTPVRKLSDNSCSKDWMLSSGEKSVSQPQPRFKRLCKYGEIKSGNLSDVEEIVGHRSCAPLNRISNKRGRGEKKVLNDARIFIDNEAEVSSEGSGDEDVDQGQDSYDDSFIDDRINPTVATMHAECDMMAIYRRSLLTQSPVIRTPHFPVDLSDGRSTSGTHTNNCSTSVSFNTERLNSDAGIPTTTTTTGISSTATGISNTASEIRKRKLSFCDGESLPIRNLEKEMLLDAAKEAPPWKEEGGGSGMDDFDSDEFYRDIDLDALEEEASRQLRLRSEEKKMMKEKPKPQNSDFVDCPSFDLGFD